MDIILKAVKVGCVVNDSTSLDLSTRCWLRVEQPEQRSDIPHLLFYSTSIPYSMLLADYSTVRYHQHLLAAILSLFCTPC